VPRLNGKPTGKAKALLKRAHCRLGKVNRRHARERKGTIIAQSPGAGHVLAAGSTVSVIQSLGPKRTRP
jgi:beta-lactam-binding protein with PASTA domain